MKKTFLLKSVLLLCTLVAGSGSVWATTVTLTSAQIKAGSGNTSYGDCSATDGGGNTWNAYAIKNKHSKATSDYEFWQIKKYASGTAYYIQVPTLGYKIKQIVLTVSSSSKPRTDGSSTATLYFSASNSTDAAGTGVASGSGASEVTIDCEDLNLKTGYITASAAVRIWDIQVTYVGEPSNPEVDGSGNVTLTTSSNMAGWRTYNNNTGNKYTVDGTTKVYYASATGENKVTLTEITGGVPANTVVILHQTSGTGIVLTKDDDATCDAPASNLLQVSSANDNLGTVYRLGYKSGEGKGVGFYQYTSASAPAGIIYVSAVSSAREYLEIEIENGDITSINPLETDKQNTGEYFNLAGQRVANPTKGLYIVNGKKVMVK